MTKIAARISNTTKDVFEDALRLISKNARIWDNATNKHVFKCIGYKVHKNELYLSYYSDQCEKFPYPFEIDQTIEFAWNWFLHNNVPSQREPDTDGSTEIGYEITTERSGVGSSDWGMFVSIKPIWFIHGK